jgi:hypothetical protein
MTVENARQRGARLSAAPHVRTFLRLLTGNSRMNTTVAQRIPGLNWDPKHRLSSLKQVEEALDALIASHGECCPLPLPVDVQAELFPEVQHSRTERRKQRSSLALPVRCVGKNAQSCITGDYGRTCWDRLSRAEFPVTGNGLQLVPRWATSLTRVSLPTVLALASRYASLASLDWLRDAGSRCMQ